MSPTRARFVTVCQQLLALGVVVVALVPATRVVSLDVVGVHPDAVKPSIGPSTSTSVDQPVRVRTRQSVAVVERQSARQSARQAARHALGGGDGVEAGGVGSP